MGVSPASPVRTMASRRQLLARFCRLARCTKVVSYLRYCGRAGRTAAIWLAPIFSLETPDGRHEMYASVRDRGLFSVQRLQTEGLPLRSRKGANRSGLVGWSHLPQRPPAQAVSFCGTFRAFPHIASST